MLSLESRISTAHDTLSEVLEAMRQMAFHLLVDGPPGCQARIDLQNVVEAVELVCDRGCEDGVFVSLDRVGEVVVVRGIVYSEVAETLLGGAGQHWTRRRRGKEVGILGTILNHFFLTAGEKKSEPFSGAKDMSGTNDMICWETGGMKPVISPFPSNT